MKASASTLLCAALLSFGCSASEDGSRSQFRSVQPVCVEDAPSEDAWTCGQTYEVSCEDLDEDIDLTVLLPAGGCAGADLQPVDGPFMPGEHEIAIEEGTDGEVVCDATLHVIDDGVPLVDVREVQMWPPNHKYNAVGLDDCIVDVDDCDTDLTRRIVSVSSDEPVNSNGDGNTEADIVPIDETHVSLRSERRGGSNGRVYTIGFELEDSSGNIAEAECFVVVAHDQSGAAAIDDGPAYTVDWD